MPLKPQLLGNLGDLPEFSSQGLRSHPTDARIASLFWTTPNRRHQMTRHSDSNKNLTSDVKNELDRAENLGLFKDQCMRSGVLQNLELLAEHHETVLRALSPEGERK